MLLSIEMLNLYNFQGLLHICKNNRDLFIGYNKMVRYDLMQLILEKQENVKMPIMQTKHFLILKNLV